MSLASEFPEVAGQWHPIKNKELEELGHTPETLKSQSNRKPWWLCPKGHEYEAYIYNRTSNKSGCPKCSGRVAIIDNCLATLCPEIAFQWHPTKNGELTPYDVTKGSHEKVWWICPQCGNEWDAFVYRRTSGTDCPFCSGNKVSKNNCLSIICPEIASQWHSTLNNGLTPYDVTKGCKTKVWWVCSKGHIWRTAICDRTNGKGCNKCAIFNRSGLNHFNWKGGKSFEPYSPEFTKELKLQIRTRDNFTCQLCCITEKEHQEKHHRVLCPHHIDYDKKNCSSQNLITLCLTCNSKVNYDRDYWTQYFQEYEKSNFTHKFMYNLWLFWLFYI